MYGYAIRMSFYVALVATAVLLCVPQYTRAQNPEIVSCFDYYQFGSVQANVETNVLSAVSGTPIMFTGELMNNNSYPVVDGALYAKVFRLRDSEAKNPNGQHVVDQFFVREGIAIPANGHMPIQFSWDVPSYAVTGDYQVAMFFVTSKKFNLLGLSFTDDVVGNTVNFSVLGEHESGVFFNKDTVTVNGGKYYFAAFPARVEASGIALVKAEVRNDTDKAVRVPVNWKVYAWDAMQDKNLIVERNDIVVVGAHNFAPVSVSVDDAQYPVYLVEGQTQWGNSTSFINVRFVREGIDRLRVNFPSVNTFPLEKGQSATLFSCLHNSGTSDTVSNGRLKLQLVDDKGRTIHEYTYAGDVTSAMMGVADNFTPDRHYDNFRLIAELYQGDMLTDEASVVYDCNDIDPEACTTDTGGMLPIDTKTLITITTSTVGLVILIIILTVLWHRVREPEEEPHSTNNTPNI